jgi:hypothetical protein
VFYLIPQQKKLCKSYLGLNIKNATLTLTITEKNASTALSGLVTPEDFDLSSGNITALTGT